MYMYADYGICIGFRDILSWYVGSRSRTCLGLMQRAMQKKIPGPYCSVIYPSPDVTDHFCHSGHSQDLVVDLLFDDPSPSPR